MTQAAPDEPEPVLLTRAGMVPVVRSALEREALRVLLRSATTSEQGSWGATRRDAYRTTRSLLAASRALGFTLEDLAAMLGVSEGSVRNRSNILTPVLPSTFLTLVPDLQPVVAAAGLWHSEPLGEVCVDARELIAWYLTISSSSVAT